MFVSQFCVKASDDFTVDDKDVDIQKENGFERTVAHEFIVGWMLLR